MKIAISQCLTAAAVASFLGFPAGACAHVPAVFADNTTVEGLRAQLVALNSQAQGIIAAGTAEGRELTAEEQTKVEDISAQFDAVEARLQAREARPDTPSPKNAASQGSGRKTTADLGSPLPASATPVNARNGLVFASGTKDFAAKLFAQARAPEAEVKPNDFFNALATRTFLPGMIANATATEGIGADGGFDVPTVWYRGVIDQALQVSEFAQRCRIFPADSNNLVIPMLDTTNRAAGVAGLIANWSGENEAQTAQVMKWRAVEMKLKKTFILSEASSELVEDGINYSQQLDEGMSLATAQSLDAAILYGTGVKMPLGIVNSPGAIEIPKEGSQVADTVVWENLVKMYARLTPAAQKRATWFVSPDVLPSLMAVKVPGTDAPALLSGGFNDAGAGAPAMSIFGRPVVVTEIAGQIGDKGDVVFADLSQYALLLKRRARMESDNGPGFNRDVVSFRMIMRVDGTPLWTGPITPFNGGATQTWATYLAARA